MEQLKTTPAYKALRGLWQRRRAPLVLNPFLQFAPPGHFYSPIPDLGAVSAERARIFDTNVNAVAGIESNTEAQLALLSQFAKFYPEFPFGERPAPGLRYGQDNPYFGVGDGILYSMLRHLRPARVVEIGSGHSSALMLDTNELFLGRKVQFTFIEPHPERLWSLISASDRDRHDVVVSRVQDVDPDRFQALDAGDILFVDSSHVAKVGSDVVHLLTHVLPAVKKNVVVHFHDIFWPFEYPEHWLRDGRAWNEAYVLKAFLQFNQRFEVMFFNSFLATQQRNAVQKAFPALLSNPGGSIWIRRTS